MQEVDASVHQSNEITKGSDGVAISLSKLSELVDSGDQAAIVATEVRKMGVEDEGRL
ncbi:hypothetical protein HN873_018703, partial [Arachis hypogaea]